MSLNSTIFGLEANISLTFVIFLKYFIRGADLKAAFEIASYLRLGWSINLNSRVGVQIKLLYL